MYCKDCGKELGKIPSEIYPGTYNGLCYSCTNKGGYIVKIYTDGCRVISYPPHCPSWRRDREEYYSYVGCPKCGGTGRNYVSRAMSKGGPYYRYCERCLKEFVKNNEIFITRNGMKIPKIINEVYLPNGRIDL